MISAKPTESNVIETLEAGARDFLVKPLNKEKLLRKIDKYNFKKKTFSNCRYFRMPECKHIDDEFLMKQLINSMENNKYDILLANYVNESRCNYCKVFKHRQ